MTTGTDSKTYEPLTMLEALRASLAEAGRYNPSDVVKPAAILWTDTEEQWVEVVVRLKDLLPELFVLGEYAPESKTGPGIWLRAVIDRVLPEIEFPDDCIPILYLPSVSRQALRAGQECPKELQPLVELQYRGNCWTQKNGRDWTVEAFLISREGGLGLDVAKDAATKASMMAVLSKLVETSLSKLRGKKLESEDFDRLEVEDPDRDVLYWLSDTETVRKEWSDGKWKSFCSRCKSDLGFDPKKDGEITGAEKLGKRQDNWGGVWERFAESPALYPGIAELLDRAMPAEQDLFDEGSTWPQKNEAMEKELRSKLRALGESSPQEARGEIVNLEEVHSSRRSWVWAKLGKAPLAQALFHLKELAEVTDGYLMGASPLEMAENFAKEGWKADAAVVRALSSVRSSEDVGAVTNAVRGIYLPWLQQTAQRLQELIESDPLPTARDRDRLEYGGKQGEIILFFDALRLDVANMVVERLRSKGLLVQLKIRWASLPTVTATSKLSQAPIAKELTGGPNTDDFLPQLSSTGEKITHYRFQKVMQSKEYQILDSGEPGDPSGKAWSEYGDLDKLGHSLQAKLVSTVDSQVDLLVERIQELLTAGWKEIQIVTDHGWLLMPGGLPSVKLPKYLTETRWLRCASVKGESQVEFPTFPWHWNPEVRVAVGPGISCFVKGNEYAHGGVSLQECVIPEIMVTPGEQERASVTSIEEIKWSGLRCRVTVSPPESDLTVDLRKSVNDPTSSICGAKSPESDGVASLLVRDDDLEETPIVVVLLDVGGQVIGKQPTLVGGEE